MAKELWHGPISKHTEWEGDESTNGLAVSGEAIQKYIKGAFDTKIGYLYPWSEGSKSQYWCFADEETCEKYLLWYNDKLNEEYKEYESYCIAKFDAPAPYSAVVNVLTTQEAGGESVSTILNTQTNNYIYFKLNIKDSGNEPVVNEATNITITFTNNGAVKTYNGSGASGKVISLLVDDYISTGTNTVTISMTCPSIDISARTSYDITVVELNLSSTFEFYKAIPREQGVLGIPFNLTGAGTKFIEWYIDGELVDNGATSPINSADYSALYNIDYIQNYEAGKHTLQMRAYETLNNTKFYGDTVYFDFEIEGAEHISILLSGIITGGGVVGAGEDPIEKLTVSGYQYEKVNIRLATYDYKKRSLSVDIAVNNKVITSLSTANNSVKTWEYTPNDYGTLPVKLSTTKTTNGITDTAVADMLLGIIKSNLNVSEYLGGITAKFSARGRSNDETNRSEWTYTNAAKKVFSATFNDVKWNDLSGWKDDALVLSNGATVTFDFNPFEMITSNGFTFEIEFETADIKSDDEIVMQFGGKGYKSSVQILATSASFISDLGTSITTNYKDGERMKLAFVVNPTTSKEAHNLMWIINNGVLERCAAYSNNDSFRNDDSEKTFTIGNPDGNVTVKIYSIRIFQSALTTQQEFENFVIDSDNIAGYVTNNDVFEADQTTVSYEKVCNKLPVLLMIGDMEKLRAYTDKKSSVLFKIKYTNPTQPEYNFILNDAYVTKQGTSSLKYPCPNFRIYTQKSDTTTIQLPNLEGFEDTVFTKGKMFYKDALGNNRHPQTHQICDGKITYSFKDNALPVKVWTIKADFAESSMTHNTGTARWFNVMNKLVTISNTVNDVTKSDKLCKTEAQAAVEKNSYKYHDAIIDRDMETYPFDIRTTVDGFPICVFYQYKEESTNPDDTKLRFMGLFNFNNDKSSTDVYGFKTIKMYEPDPKKLDADGNALGLKQSTIFKKPSIVCWEGSANEEAIGKFNSIRFDMGTEDENGAPSYDYNNVEDRNIFAAFETRYPDLDDLELANGKSVSGNLFNNTSSLETLVRWIYFTKNALDLRVFKKKEYWTNPSAANNEYTENDYEDGYSFESFVRATDAEIAEAKRTGANTLFICTSNADEGTAATYENTTWLNGAVWKSIIVEEDGKNVEKFVDENGAILEDQEDINLRVNLTEYYTKRVDIDFENVEKHVWTAEEGHTYNDYIYTGYVMNWQGRAMKQMTGVILKGGVVYSPVKTTDSDYNDTYKDFLMTEDDYVKGTVGDHNVEVFLTQQSDGSFTYVDGYGKEQKYVVNSRATVKGQCGYVNSYDYRGKTPMDFFNGEYFNHFDIYKLASYFIYTKRFATVDQMVKNIMLTSENGAHWYYIHYDNDTINGVRNDSLIKYRWDITRSTYDASVNNYAYAGFASVLWNNLENSSAFMKVVVALDKALSKLPDEVNGQKDALTYDGACYWYDTMQADKWCERLYNSSEDFKYISPYIEDSSNAAYLAFLQGNRRSHRHWWLRHRFDLVDAEWGSGEYSDFYIGGYVGGAKKSEQIIKIKAAADFYYGYMTNTEIAEGGVYLKADQEYVFRAASDYNVGDPFRLLAPYQIKELDFSVSPGIVGGNMLNLNGDAKADYVTTRGTQLKKLIIGSPAKDSLVGQISGLGRMNQLQWFNITRCAGFIQNPDIINNGNLHIFEAEQAALTSFFPANGSVFYRVVLPSVTTVYNEKTGVQRSEGSNITKITLNNVTFDYNLKFDYTEQVEPGFFYTPDANLKEIVFNNVAGIDTQEFIMTWWNAIRDKSADELKTYSATLTGINWTNVDIQKIIDIKNAGLDAFDIEGYVQFAGMTYEQYKEIVELYTEYVFIAGGQLVFDAPQTQFLFTDVADEEKNVTVVSGTEINVSTKIFPLDEGAKITYVMWVGGKQVLTTNANKEWVSGGFTLNSVTGKLTIAEGQTDATCTVGVSVIATGAQNANVTIPENRLVITAKGVTIPKGFNLTGATLPIKFETISASEFNVVTTVNNAEHDAKIKNIEFALYSSEDNTLVASGTDLLESSYVKVTFDAETQKLNVIRVDVPYEDTEYDLTIIPVFNTTIEEKKRPYSRTIHITCISVIPEYFTVSFDTAKNEGVKYNHCLAAAYSQDMKYDVVGIENRNKQLVGIKIHSAGTYHFDLNYFTKTGIPSKAGVVTPNIHGDEYAGYKLSVTGNVDGFDITLADTSNLSSPNVITPIGGDIYLTFGTGGIEVKIGDSSNIIYLNGVGDSNTIDTGVFVTYPTAAEIVGHTAFNLNNNTSKSLDYTYNIHTSYNNGSDTVDTTNVNTPYSVISTINQSDMEVNVTTDNGPLTAVSITLNNTETGFTISAAGVPGVGTAKFGVTTTITAGRYVNRFTTNFTVVYTAADANTKSDMKLGSWYIIDKDCAMYEITGADGVTSAAWNRLNRPNSDIIGVATKWNYDNDSIEQDKVFAIALKDIPNKIAFSTKAIPQAIAPDYVYLREQGYSCFKGYENTRNVVAAEGYALEDTAAYQAWHYFDDYPNVQGYVGSFGEMVYACTFLYTELSKLLVYYGGDALVNNNMSILSEFYLTSTIWQESRVLILLTGLITEGSNTGAAGSYATNSTSQFSNKFYCRPMIYITD